jgi:hypothetical protein
MIGLSEAILQEPERQALAALSLFPPKPASFSEEAALAVTAASVEVLDRLVDVGLLESRGGDRYSLHQIICDYARAIPRSAALAEQRLVAYVFNYVEQYRRQYRMLEQELELILTALDLAPHVGYHTEFVQCVCAIFCFLCTRGRFVLAERLLLHADEIDSPDVSA